MIPIEHPAIWSARASTVEDLGLVLNRFNAPDAEGPAFVMVHGLGVSSKYFEPLAAALADAGIVWLVDLPGYGASPKPGRDVTIDEHARVLGAALDDAGIENPMLIGHSWGCQVVSMLADQRPDLSDRLVLLSPTINPARRTVFKQFIDLLKDAWREPPRAAAFGVYSYLFTGKARYYLAQVAHMVNDVVEERLGRIRTPTLLVNGERDPIVPREWAALAVSLLENGRLEIVPGAHVIMYTAPAEIAALLRDFAR